ncbi:alpha/beta hydrolase family protein [Paraburkholderia dilworthii]|uniref:alpha/beta hydrolase family protein n=1 Tax=Paraburkholderia dilworthii TaxID=948106 RepID=UPI00047FE5AC|nr:alpha/beta hydrolase [Paraburkholderia dilworthii]
MRTFLALVLFCLSATVAHAAGIKFLTVPADDTGPALKAVVWTPCAEAAEDLTVGPYVLRGRRDCPTAGNRLPLVVVSHGHGGSYLGHHDLAEVLADAGFVVAAINHPGDTFSDMSHAADISEFVERPTDIKRLVDFMLAGAPDAGKIDATKVGFFGFSRGGYTGLVLAGGNPDFAHANVPCADPNLPICRQIKQQKQPLMTVTHDERIKAYVLADPLNEFPRSGDLQNVDAPIQLWASQFGGDGVLPETMPALADALPKRPDFHVVPKSAHFAFLAPCPASLMQSAPEVCVDAAGFDRAAFHTLFDQMALQFFTANLR